MFSSKIGDVEYKFKFEHKRKKRGKQLKTTCSVTFGDKEIVAKTNCIPPDVPDTYIGKMKALQNALDILFPNDRIKRIWVWHDFSLAFPKPLSLKMQLRNIKRFLRENHPEILTKYLEHRR